MTNAPAKLPETNRVARNMLMLVPLISAIMLLMVSAPSATVRAVV